MTKGPYCHMVCSRILAIDPVVAREKGVDRIRVHKFSSNREAEQSVPMRHIPASAGDFHTARKGLANQLLN